MKKIQLLAYLMALSLLAACSSCPDQYGDDDGTEKMYFSLRWQPRPDVWQAAIGAFGYIPKDSVKLYDEDYNLVESLHISDGGRCSFTIVDETTPRGEDVVKQYYFYLSQQDTDTIRVEFKLKKDNCKNVMNYGRFFYNNQLIDENENISFNLGGSVAKPK